MLDFDPNKKKQKSKVWASYVPGRRPEFKTYTQRNYASSALSYHNIGILYKLENDEWVEVDRCEKPTECAHCGGSLYNQFNDWRTRSPHQVHIKGVAAYKLPWVCGLCYDKHFGYKPKLPIDPHDVGKVQIDEEVFGNH